MSNEERDRLQEKLVARSWLDKTFRELLLSNPVAALASIGLTIAVSTTVIVNLSGEGRLIYQEFKEANRIEITIPDTPVAIVDLTDEVIEGLLDAIIGRFCS